jgi:uncharacterized protein YndB with AHSA1/START domain
MFHVTVRFEEKNAKTRMDITMTLPTPEAAQVTKKFIQEAGVNATWDRLAEYLAETKGSDQFVINRTFEAPIDLVFQMWTDPKHLSKWLPPKGATMKFIEHELPLPGKYMTKQPMPNATHSIKKKAA